MTRVVDVARDAVGLYAPGIVEVYRAVFTEPPWNEPPEEADRFGLRLLRYAGEEGFRLVVVLDGGQVVGFSMGTAWEEGWDLLDAIAADLDPEWTRDCFFLMELAVLPGYRGRGLGARLHDELLAGVHARTAILTTNRVGHPAATALYVRRGWRMLLPDWKHCADCYPIHVMGLADVASSVPWTTEVREGR